MWVAIFLLVGLIVFGLGVKDVICYQTHIHTPTISPQVHKLFYRTQLKYNRHGNAAADVTGTISLPLEA